MSRKIIDLSYPVSDWMLVYPNSERPVFSWMNRVISEGFNQTRMTMQVHTGTHVDSPLHFLADGSPIDEIPLNHFYGETMVFRLKDEPRGQEFGADELVPSLDMLEEGGIFVIETGIGDYAETAEYNSQFPRPSMSLVKLLVQKNIRSYMTDATAVDPVGSHDNRIHKALFKAGVPIVENLANLGELPGDSRFVISALPLKLTGREGAPCRATAII